MTKKLTDTLLKIGNPFTEHNNITSLVSKNFSSCSQRIVEIEKLDKEQFETYLQSAFVEKTASIFDTIKNKTNFFKTIPPKDNTTKLKKKSLDIVTNMFISAQQRNVNEVNGLLRYDIDIPPLALIKPKTGGIMFAEKSKVAESIVELVNNDDTNNGAIFMDRGVNVLIIDASVTLLWYAKIGPQKTAKPFLSMPISLKEIRRRICTIPESGYIVFDQYFVRSVKSVTRCNRGAEEQGTRYTSSTQLG